MLMLVRAAGADGDDDSDGADDNHDVVVVVFTEVCCALMRWIGRCRRPTKTQTPQSVAKRHNRPQIHPSSPKSIVKGLSSLLNTSTL